jgi:hypothetical protein
VLDETIVPSMESPITHPANDRPPTKYSSVLVFRRAKYKAIPIMPPR